MNRRPQEILGNQAIEMAQESIDAQILTIGTPSADPKNGGET